MGDESGDRCGGFGYLCAAIPHKFCSRFFFFLFLALLGGIGSSAASYLYPYMAELGANESMMGIALTVSTLTEIPIFFFGHRLVKKFGSYGLLTLALMLFGIRSLLYAA